MDPAQWQQIQQAMMALQQQPSSMPGANGPMYSSPDNLEGRGQHGGVAYQPAQVAMDAIIANMKGEGRKSLNPAEIFNALPLLPMKMLENVVTDPLSMVRQGSQLTGDVMSGKVDPMSEEGAQRAAELAFNAATGGQSKGTFAPSMSPGIGIFGGVGAKTADFQKLEIAKSMENKGVPSSEIWMQTGWGRGPDEKWRFEIPDTDVKAKWFTSDEAENHYHPIQNIMPHNALYAAYPELGKTPASAKLLPPEWGAQGAFLPQKGVIHAAADDLGPLTSVFLHELQHGVQQKEDFMRGSAPDAPAVQNLAMRASKDIPEFSRDWGMTVQDIAKQIYHRIAGEVEARNVQYRNQFGVPTDIPPWTTQDYPWSQQYAQAAWDAPVLPVIPRK